MTTTSCLESARTHTHTHYGGHSVSQDGSICSQTAVGKLEQTTGLHPSLTALFNETNAVHSSSHVHSNEWHIWHRAKSAKGRSEVVRNTSHRQSCIGDFSLLRLKKRKREIVRLWCCCDLSPQACRMHCLTCLAIKRHSDAIIKSLASLK